MRLIEVDVVGVVLVLGIRLWIFSGPNSYIEIVVILDLSISQNRSAFDFHQNSVADFHQLADHVGEVDHPQLGA